MGNGKVVLTTCGLLGVGLGALAIKTYGEYKFYEGRISKYEELRPLLERILIVLNVELGSKEEA